MLALIVLIWGGHRYDFLGIQNPSRMIGVMLTALALVVLTATASKVERRKTMANRRRFWLSLIIIALMWCFHYIVFSAPRLIHPLTGEALIPGLPIIPAINGGALLLAGLVWLCVRVSRMSTNDRWLVSPFRALRESIHLGDWKDDGANEQDD